MDLTQLTMPRRKFLCNEALLVIRGLDLIASQGRNAAPEIGPFVALRQIWDVA